MPSGGGRALKEESRAKIKELHNSVADQGNSAGEEREPPLMGKAELVQTICISCLLLAKNHFAPATSHLKRSGEFVFGCTVTG